MEKVVRKFGSFAEAEKADIEFWQNCSGTEKIKILESIRQSWYNYEPAERLQRVYRIVKRKKR